MFPALFSQVLQATQHSLYTGSCGVYTLTCQPRTSQARAVGGFPDAFYEGLYRQNGDTPYVWLCGYVYADADADTDTDKRRHSFTAEKAVTLNITNSNATKSLKPVSLCRGKDTNYCITVNK